jgi:flagellar hook assembly protein FlgD
MSNGMVTGYTKTSRPWSITRGIETNIDGTGVEGNSETIVSSTSIKISAAPNPARVMTQISFSLPSAGMAEVTVYNIAGQKVASLVSENLSAGKHSLTWNLKDAKGNAVPNGVYFYQLTAGNRTLSQKIVVVR